MEAGYAPDAAKKVAEQMPGRQEDESLGDAEPIAWKEPVGCKETLVCVDESGFQLLPACTRSWAPVGEPLLLRTPYRRQHLSVIAGITPAGKLYQHVLEHAVRGVDCVRFLWHLLRRIEGKLVVVWDNLPAHRAAVMRQFLSTGPARRLELISLPPYAPELNPQEGIWKHTKLVELANVCCENLRDLRHEFRAAMQRLRQKPRVIFACFQHAGFV